MKICEHIYNNLQLGHKKEDISSLEDLEDFFANIPEGDEESWPLFQADETKKVNYAKAKVHSDKFGFGNFIDIVSHVKINNTELTIVENIEAEDCLKIEIGSIIRRGDCSCGNFVFDFIHRHREFIKKYDESQRKLQNSLHSELLLFAHSDPTGNPVTNGGYTWAIQGFDFVSPAEKQSAQKAFQSFAAKHKVNIEDKDIKLFTKPCHFAAFQCGAKVNGKNLGKAFLLQYSWYGKMSVAQKNSEPEEYRFAKAYHLSHPKEKAVQNSVLELNKKYLRMMKKYYDRYSGSEKEGIVTKLGKKFSALTCAFRH